MLPVGVAVHDVEQGSRSQQRITAAAVAVISRPDQRRFHFERVFQVRLHVQKIAALHLHEKLKLRVKPLGRRGGDFSAYQTRHRLFAFDSGQRAQFGERSEEHTSELQSRENLVCRLLLEKKKKEK